MQQTPGYQRFFAELKRRHVFRVMAVYGIVGFVLIQLVDLAVPAFLLPDWTYRLVALFLLLGFPVAIVLAWALEMTPEGVRRTTAASPGELTEIISAPASKRWPAGVLALLGMTALLAGAWYVGRRSAPAATDRQATGSQVAEAPGAASVAVLPFEIRAKEGDEDAVIFSEGMHDDVLTQLSKIESLKVISRTTMARYAHTDLSIPQIASQLGVATVLEGGIQRSGARVRVNVQLIKAATDEHLWAETYDEELSAANIFAIQSDLARKIAGALQAALTPETEARLEVRPTESLAAFDLYARARHILGGARGNAREGLLEAQGLLEQAIEADSTYAQAWYLLATAHFELWYRAHAPAEEALPEAWEAVDRALALDPDLAEAHARRGRLLMVDLRYEEAEAEYVRALELNPSSAEALGGYSNLLADLSRYDEAVAAARRAVELDPLSPGRRVGLANRLAWARQWPEVVAESRKMIEMEPENTMGYYHLGLGQAMLGQQTEAIAAYREACALDPSDAYLPAALAWAYAHAGMADSALAVLEAVPAQGPMLKEIAIVYGELGDLDTAYEYLDRVAAEDPGILGELRSDPTADSLRADPRWKPLLGKVGLE
ncbi:MAG: tetratricopeptide repeat protein [Candidatus Palauibacterales bacterium]|nr:tetratricopeptide repeat protein [Candidatus Palauibacterales bacterium]